MLLRAKDTLLKSLSSQTVPVAVVVTVHAVRGSAPREVGAWMAVLPSTQMLGTIGGGQLEWQAWQQACQWLRAPADQQPTLAHPLVQRFALGPSLGQCCGGEVHLRFECVGPADVSILQERWQVQLPTVALFGGGHVGRAVVQVLQPLPFRVHWVDSRDEVFPPQCLAAEEASLAVQTEHSDPVQAAVPHLPAGSLVLIMSFSHAEDLEILAACLQRQRERADLPFIGLIGSRSKWASFAHRLQARGFTPTELDAVTCPIGVAGIHDKRPEVIAVAVAAQLLQVVSATVASTALCTHD
ncbi:xanthine dehydrogenase accessory protein XdhC [Curvibacter sp. CHRR-16]|uniref:xanthine dehydrogenase accessory protein XdhC n=1 Tax=Curvibacter sp. CHRR-16 TaxID=2835872 RepID=UPI001BD9AF2A|nr:xanthine dehydrogenase accessory protein XdhC [Curvibacter sp. CHRR-16]MBT0569099.1 xanthine dehydrogenase accessory protein XdhC [Curvibacter sp. CHRR-16]